MKVWWMRKLTPSIVIIIFSRIVTFLQLTTIRVLSIWKKRRNRLTAVVVEIMSSLTSQRAQSKNISPQLRPIIVKVHSKYVQQRFTINFGIHFGNISSGIFISSFIQNLYVTPYSIRIPPLSSESRVAENTTILSYCPPSTEEILTYL